VGLAAQGDPFPAPTGVVDITLRRADGADGLSVLADYGRFDSYGLELDGRLVVVEDRLSVAGGASAYRNRFGNGGRGTSATFGLVPHWRVSDGGGRGDVLESLDHR